MVQSTVQVPDQYQGNVGVSQDRVICIYAVCSLNTKEGYAGELMEGMVREAMKDDGWKPLMACTRLFRRFTAK
jgi:hypothetical protein